MHLPQHRLALIAILSASVMGPRAVASQSSAPIAWFMATSEGLVMQGRPFTVALKAVIPRGMHLYALTQPPGGPVAARIAVDSSSAFMLGGTVVARQPDRALDPSFGIATETYSDTVTFTVPLVAQASGAQQLGMSVDYQSCTDRLCLPPRRVQLTLTLSVAPGGAMAAPGYTLLPPMPRGAGPSRDVTTGTVTHDAETVQYVRGRRWSVLWPVAIVGVLVVMWGALRVSSRRR